MSKVEIRIDDKQARIEIADLIDTFRKEYNPKMLLSFIKDRKCDSGKNLSEDDIAFPFDKVVDELEKEIADYILGLDESQRSEQLGSLRYYSLKHSSSEKFMKWVNIIIDEEIENGKLIFNIKMKNEKTPRLVTEETERIRRLIGWVKGDYVKKLEKKQVWKSADVIYMESLELSYEGKRRFARRLKTFLKHKVGNSAEECHQAYYEYMMGVNNYDLGYESQLNKEL